MGRSSHRNAKNVAVDKPESKAPDPDQGRGGKTEQKDKATNFGTVEIFDVEQSSLAGAFPCHSLSCRGSNRSFSQGKCTSCTARLLRNFTFDVAESLVGHGLVDVMSPSVHGSSTALQLAFADGQVILHVHESPDHVKAAASAGCLNTKAASMLEQNYADEVAELTEGVARNRAAYERAKSSGELTDVGALSIEHDQLTDRLAKLQATTYNKVYRDVHVPVRLKNASYALEPNSMIRVGGSMSVQWLRPRGGGTSTVDVVLGPANVSPEQTTFPKTVLPTVQFAEVDELQQQHARGQLAAGRVLSFRETKAAAGGAQ